MHFSAAKGGSPSVLARTVTFKVNDGTADSNELTRSIAVTAVNDAPVLAGIETTALTYTENDSATAITATITISDVDSVNLASATVQITGNYQNGEDVLSFANTATINNCEQHVFFPLMPSGVEHTLSNNLAYEQLEP